MKRPSPTNTLTHAIEHYVTLKGGFVARINVSGFYREGIGYIKSGSTAGMSDLVVCINGRFLAIEIKVGKDKQSEVQKQIQGRIEYSKGTYTIATDIDSFKTWFDNWLTTHIS